MPNVDSIIDQLRVLSARKSPQEEEELSYIENQSRMIGAIVGAHPPFSRYDELKKKREKNKLRKEQTKKQKEVETFVLDSKEDFEVNSGKKHGKYASSIASPAPAEMTFEEKRKLVEAKYPNGVSAEKRAWARERLNFIANNREQFFNSTQDISPPANEVLNVISSRSWTSGPESEDLDDKLVNYSGEEIRQDTGRDASVFPGVWKFGSYDNFSKMTYDAAFSNTTQSQSTILDETTTPITTSPTDLPSLHTCTD